MIALIWAAGHLLFVIEAFEAAIRHGATLREPRAFRFPGVELACLWASGVSLGFAVLAGLTGAHTLAAVPAVLAGVALIDRKTSPSAEDDG